MVAGGCERWMGAAGGDTSFAAGADGGLTCWAGVWVAAPEGVVVTDGVEGVSLAAGDGILGLGAPLGGGDVGFVCFTDPGVAAPIEVVVPAGVDGASLAAGKGIPGLGLPLGARMVVAAGVDGAELPGLEPAVCGAASVPVGEGVVVDRNPFAAGSG